MLRTWRILLTVNALWAASSDSVSAVFNLADKATQAVEDWIEALNHANDGCWLHAYGFVLSSLIGH
jgi:hypothetical protein